MKRLASNSITYIILIAFLLISIMPIFWMVAAALKDPSELDRNPNPLALPQSITFQNLSKAWTVGKMGGYFINSLIVAVPSVTVILILSSLAAFAFGKLRFSGREPLFYFFLFGMMVPIQAMIIPIYYNMKSLGLINSYWAMILPHFGLAMPFAIFMMRSFYREVPDELMEAARIDGCGNFKIYSRIMLPLVMPALSALLVFQFMWSWNEFLLPLLFIYSDKYRTLPLGLMYFQGQYTSNQSLLAAGVTITIVPIILVYLIFQRKFIEGITSGSVKG